MMRQGLRLRTRWYIGLRLSDLQPMTTLVAFTLASWANADGLGARPSLLSVADGCRLTRRSVVTHIKKLEVSGWIRRTSGRGVPNRYSLLVPTDMELKIEATLGEWSREPISLPGGEVGNLSAPSRESDDTKWGTPVPTSLIEPYKKQPTSTSEPPSGSSTQEQERSDEEEHEDNGNPKAVSEWLDRMNPRRRAAVETKGA